MCGIFGFVSPRIERPGEFYHFATRLFVESQSRGTDASGFAALSGGNLVTDKRPYAAEYFTKLSRPWRELRGSRRVNLIGHTRAATCGSPHNNNNNHPFHGPRFVMAHNGWIGSHSTIAKYNGINLQTECDSEIILHFLEKGRTVEDGIIQVFNNLDDVGVMAVCVLDKATGNVHLFRNTSSPCVAMRFRRWNAIVFASTPRIIVDAAANIIDEWGSIYDHAELLFGNEIPAFTNVIVKPNGKVEARPLADKLDFVKYKRASVSWINNYESDFGDYSVFAGMRRATAERLRQIALNERANDSSSLDETAHDGWVCANCKKPLHLSSSNYPDPAAPAGERRYVCETCYRSYQDKKADTSDTAKARRKVLRMILPSTLINEEHPADTITQWREPLLDHELDEGEVAVYMRFSEMPTERKIEHWQDTTYRSIVEMSDGEFLAYVDFVRGLLVAA